MARRANPRCWGHGGTVPSQQCAERGTTFERFVETERIPREFWAMSHRVRAWVKQHANSRYVPEDLLDRLGIVPTVNFGPGPTPGGRAA